MKTKNSYFIFAGFLNFFTAFLHLIGGQLDLVNPLLQSSLSLEIKTQWLGVWHMATIILFASTIILFISAYQQKFTTELIKFIGYLYILLSIPFMITNLIYGILVPQWILLLPIGILTLIGIKKTTIHA